MPSRLRPTSARKSRNNCHLWPLVTRQLSFDRLDRAKASIDDEIRNEGEAHGKDDAGDDQTQ